MVTDKYTKPALSINQQIEFLANQGLIIKDHALAHHALSTVSYYRFSGYLLPFKLPHNGSRPRQFKDQIMFEQIWQLYQFDRELRLIVSDAIEKIEIAFRTALSNVTSIELHPFWYIDPFHFKAAKCNKAGRTKELRQKKAFFEEHMENIKKISKNKQEIFIQHYHQKYKEPEYPPIWMIIESISFGSCSKMYQNIQSIAIRNEIASYLGQHATVIESWIRSLTYSRNLCAHHARLWNRWFVSPPLVPKNDPCRDYFLPNENYRFHLIAYVIQRLLEKISPEFNWKQDLFNLFEKFEVYPGKEMGFQSNWRVDKFWDI